MGARLIVRHDSGAARRRETRTIATVLASIVGPCLLMALLIASDMRSDLSELRPVFKLWADGAELVGWPQLRPDAALPRDRARMLGYMMDGYRPVPDGAPVAMFVLMPDAGHLLHPAHRIREEMVEIWLTQGASVTYKDRDMVWVEGLLRRSEGRSAYAMTDAFVARADQRAIALWFAFR